MSTESDRRDTRKALAYDLIHMLEQTPDKMWSLQELKQIISALVLDE